ncbi:MAG: LysR family transcriptional regulator, partial [Gammaproteobacteria bacterium]|nr:LysR family transcriptional regulator [Gammaproteobacteria bacterium]
QSAFSTAIKELEETLGARLVDRTNRQVTITNIGQDIAVRARDCLGGLEELVEVAQGQRRPLEAELRLGVIPTIAPFLLPRLLPRLRRAYPQLRLLLVEEQTERLHTKLLDGQIDLMLLALPYELRSTVVLPLFEDRFLLACRENTKHVDPENYRLSKVAPETVLLLEDGHCLRDHALDACRLSSATKVSRFAATSLLTLVEMVDADLGITFLPEMAVDTGLLKHTRIKTYSLSPRSHRTIGLAWRKGSARVPEFELFGDFLTLNRRDRR